MVKTLTSHGNSLALIIDKPILELLGIGPDTPLQISTDGHSLVVSPLRNTDDDADFHRALEWVNKEHGETLRRLGNA
jgi:antitoxin component of MazEF toxin-antitoxin module